MPTERPRLTITLTPDIDRALTDFSRLTGESKSAFIVQVLGEAVPHLQRMTVVIQQAKQLHGEAYQAARVSLSKYADAVMHQAEGVLKSSDLFLDHVEGEVAGGTRAAATAPPAPSSSGRALVGPPPSVNKGVGDSQKGRGKESKVVQMRAKP